MMKKAAFLLLIFVTTLVAAEVPEERALAAEPMAHAVFNSSSRQVKVHYAHLQGYIVPEPDDGNWQANMRRDVDDCLRLGNGAGQGPDAYPDHLMVTRSDTYLALNRSIEYSRSLLFSIDPDTCKVKAIGGYSARLVSTQGSCQIDLREKTAFGFCDPTGHAGAKPGTPPPDGVGPYRQNLPRKTILGIECEVFALPQQVREGRSTCVARGGSFRWSSGMSNMGLALDIENMFGLTQRAVEAKLDAHVSESIFTPYMTGGFRIRNRGRED